MKDSTIKEVYDSMTPLQKQCVSRLMSAAYEGCVYTEVVRKDRMFLLQHFKRNSSKFDVAIYLIILAQEKGRLQRRLEGKEFEELEGVGNDLWYILENSGILREYIINMLEKEARQMNIEEKLAAIFDEYNMPTSNPFYHAVRNLFLDATDTSPCKACSMNEVSCCGCPTYYAWKSRKEGRK